MQRQTSVSRDTGKGVWHGTTTLGLFLSAVLCMFPAGQGDSPGGRRLQPHTGHLLPHGQQDLDVSEWCGHSSGARTVAVLHRDPRERRPALPVGAHLQGH